MLSLQYFSVLPCHSTILACLKITLQFPSIEFSCCNDTFLSTMSQHGMNFTVFHWDLFVDACVCINLVHISWYHLNTSNIASSSLDNLVKDNVTVSFIQHHCCSCI